MGSGTDGEDDPFARIAAVLRDDQPAALPPQKRALRKSRPSFSELAPVIPPGTIPTPPPSNTSPSKPPPPIPYVPSVIISEDEPPPQRSRVADGPTVRGRRATTVRKRRGMNTSLVIVVLMLSLVVFGLGIATFLATRPTAPAAPAGNAADLSPASAAE